MSKSSIKYESYYILVIHIYHSLRCNNMININNKRTIIKKKLSRAARGTATSLNKNSKQ